MISLLAMILCGWLLYKMLAPRMLAPIYVEPPAPLQITIHLHQPVIVLTKAEPPSSGNERRW